MIPLGTWGLDVSDLSSGGAPLVLDVAVYHPDGLKRATISLDGPPDDPDGLGVARVRASARKARSDC